MLQCWPVYFIGDTEVLVTMKHTKKNMYIKNKANYQANFGNDTDIPAGFCPSQNSD